MCFKATLSSPLNSSRSFVPTWNIHKAFKTEEEDKERIENLTGPKKPPSDRLIVRTGDEPQAAVLKGRVVWGERRMFTDLFRWKKNRKKVLTYGKTIIVLTCFYWVNLIWQIHQINQSSFCMSVSKKSLDFTNREPEAKESKWLIVKKCSILVRSHLASWYDYDW